MSEAKQVRVEFKVFGKTLNRYVDIPDGVSDWAGYTMGVLTDVYETAAKVLVMETLTAEQVEARKPTAEDLKAWEKAREVPDSRFDEGYHFCMSGNLRKIVGPDDPEYKTCTCWAKSRAEEIRAGKRAGSWV